MSWQKTTRWFLAALTTVVLAAPTAPAVQTAAAAPAVRSVQAVQAAPAAPPITRARVLERARTWLTADNGRPVPYSQNRYWSDGYRQDCSGYASMALGLPAPGPNTVKLRNDGWTRRIAMHELAPGDLVIKADSNDPDQRHVVIFDGWVDGSRTAYNSYEQAGGAGTRWKRHSYGVSGRDGYHAYRPVNITG
ncbi:hypothetical protein V1L54_08450 [Streptomyces sp. TRM 70361]|uniref:hypothetical protein n=1 Tax=Streptomyces sp. TRM 70361 TaxID=3116553 RepID=UPI002E7AB9AF|nr:hypothetical protein [Streptomyces sp. TRM 70361]MEE1939445.1 hypothetical protein [Streptomyces sp. TRM 70361]